MFGVIWSLPFRINNYHRQHTISSLSKTLFAIHRKYFNRLSFHETFKPLSRIRWFIVWCLFSICKSYETRYIAIQLQIYEYPTNEKTTKGMRVVNMNFPTHLYHFFIVFFLRRNFFPPQLKSWRCKISRTKSESGKVLPSGWKIKSIKCVV